MERNTTTRVCFGLLSCLLLNTREVSCQEHLSERKPSARGNTEGPPSRSNAVRMSARLDSADWETLSSPRSVSVFRLDPHLFESRELFAKKYKACPKILLYPVVSKEIVLDKKCSREFVALLLNDKSYGWNLGERFCGITPSIGIVIKADTTVRILLCFGCESVMIKGKGKSWGNIQPSRDAFLKFANKRFPNDMEKIDNWVSPEQNYFPPLVTSPQGTGQAFISAGPITLSRIRKAIASEETEDKVSCDLRLFADLKAGYMLRRKIFQEAVKNRTIAAWRRENRLFRIHRLLGTDETHPTEKSWVKRLGEENIFPMQNDALGKLVQAMPSLKTHRFPRHTRNSPSAESAFQHLPEFLLNLKRIDAFVSVEPNALFFENHYAFFPAPPAAATLTHPATPSSTPKAAGEAEALDFEKE
jgi:hypothetical protein